MDYKIVQKSVMQYNIYYSDGMKDKANSLLQDLYHAIEMLPQDEYDSILERLVYDICETERFSFLFKRGNGQIPYMLKKVLRSWLFPRCQQNKMPELRWFYQIFRHDPDNAETAYTFLNDAYVQDADNCRTQELVFERNVISLEFGLHELPAGLLISDEEAQIIMQQCDAIIKLGNAPQNLIDKYLGLKHEYLMYISSGI